MAEAAPEGEVFRGHVREGARELGADMRDEQWLSMGDEDRELLMWLHPPSNRCVEVSGPVPRREGNYSCLGVPPLYDEPDDPKTRGYIVRCLVADELGNPIDGSAFWVESFGEAVRRARVIRTSILAEHPPKAYADQLTLDDALPKRSEGA